MKVLCRTMDSSIWGVWDYWMDSSI